MSVLSLDNTPRDSDVTAFPARCWYASEYDEIAENLPVRRGPMVNPLHPVETIIILPSYSHFHVVGQYPQSGEVVLQENVNRDELKIRAQQWLVMAGIGSGDKQSVPAEDERIVLADVVCRLANRTASDESASIRRCGS